METFERAPGRWRRLVLAGAAAVLALIIAVVAGCSSGPKDAEPTPASPSPASPSAPVSPVSPLTGLPGEAGRILAVKIDNIVHARPQTGVNSAAVVYAIEVEGGLSRFLAIYDSNQLPALDRIGPVRSARESDLEILQQYGKVDYVYSGAQTRFLPVLAEADIFDISPKNDGSSFFRSRDKAAPYNQYVVPSAVLRNFPDSATARDIGFRFGDAPAGGDPAESFTARMPAASFTFTWSAEQGKYLVAIDGRPAETTDAGQMGAPTVVVQRVADATSPRGLRDSSGDLSPYAPTVGTGDAVFLRDGRAYQGTWSRPDAGAGTEFTYAGQRMNFHPGQVWVVLEPR